MASHPKSISSNPLVSESENTSQINEASASKLEALTQAFYAIDKDLNSQVTKQELLQFLDSHLTGGKKFDRNLAEKIFSLFDIDKSNTISVDEFIKSFISIEEEIKRTMKDLQAKFAIEKESNFNLQKKLIEYQSESFNPDGVCPNGQITVEITEVEFNKKIKGIDGIQVRILFKNEIKETKFVTGITNRIAVGETFTFKPTSRKDVLTFELRSLDDKKESFVIGLVNFSLTGIPNQEEYIIDLIIPEENNHEITEAKIKSKVTFFWSYYLLYEDKLKKSENMLAKLQRMIDKTNEYLILLNEPMKMFQVIEDKEKQLSSEISDSKQGNTLKINSYVGLQYKTADNIENYLKDVLKKSAIPWMGAINLLIYASIILGFVNTLARSDFPNIIVPAFILFILETNFGKDPIGNLSFFLKLVIGTLVYDILWLIFCGQTFRNGSDKYTGGNENMVMFIVLISTVSNCLVKVILGIAIWIQKLKAERPIAHDQASMISIDKPKNLV